MLKIYGGGGDKASINTYTQRHSHREISTALMQFALLESTYHFTVRNNLLFWTFLEMLKLSTYILPFFIYQCSCILSILTPNLQSLQFCAFLIQACYLFLLLFKFLLESLKIEHMHKCTFILSSYDTLLYCGRWAPMLKRHLLPINQIFRV